MIHRLLTVHHRAGGSAPLWSCHAHSEQQTTLAQCATHQWSHQSFSMNTECSNKVTLCSVRKERHLGGFYLTLVFPWLHQDEAWGHYHTGLANPPDAEHFVCLNLASFHLYPWMSSLVLLGRLWSLLIGRWSLCSSASFLLSLLAFENLPCPMALFYIHSTWSCQSCVIHCRSAPSFWWSYFESIAFQTTITLLREEVTAKLLQG